MEIDQEIIVEFLKQRDMALNYEEKISEELLNDLITKFLIFLDRIRPISEKGLMDISKSLCTAYESEVDRYCNKCVLRKIPYPVPHTMGTIQRDCCFILWHNRDWKKQ